MTKEKKQERNDAAELPQWQRETAAILAATNNKDLTEKMIEALQTDRFFITISSIAGAAKEQMSLKHLWLWWGYAINDIAISINHLIGEYTKKDNPGSPAMEIVNTCEQIKAKEQLPGLLKKSLISNGTFITISYQKKYRATDKDDLQHYWARLSFPKEAVIPSLKFILDDYRVKFEPNSELESGQWH